MQKMGAAHSGAQVTGVWIMPTANIQFNLKGIHMVGSVRAAVKTCIALAIGSLSIGLAQAQSRAERFIEYDGQQTANPALLAARAANISTKVMVVMSEASVAEARASKLDHKLSQQEHQTVVERVRSQHDSVQRQLEDHGGKEIKRFHGALNGMKVTVAASELAAIAAMPGVVKVLPVGVYHLDNSSSIPYLGVPALWQAQPGLAGENIKVAIIDSGIDYTHANFGGPGTTAAFSAAAASSAAPADAAMFGPSAPKVKGGIDLVGDAYNANVAGSMPAPDANPLDCGGHGSHVAGTVAGFGVSQDGSTYAGVYNDTIYQPGAWKIGPGVAPKAELYAVRVFGCAGSTQMVEEGIDWAINNDMDVINMSLGSSFGYANDASALAASNAARAGVVVVTSAGNSGPAPYLTGSPSTGDGVVSVAAIDGHPTYPGASVGTSTGLSLTAQVSNDVPLPQGPLDVVVLRNADGTVSLGCAAAEYAGTQGKLVVTLRGVCARVDRVNFGQKAGAAAVAMINTTADYPVFEGRLAGVTIPFLGFAGGSGADLAAAKSVTLSAKTIANPAVGMTASFSSGGPRMGDSMLKPTLSAPGVGVSSTLIGSGTEPITESGTSMASPHVAGVAALVRQAHPTWTQGEVVAAMAQTANPDAIPHYATRLNGAGLVQPLAATQTQAYVSVEEDPTASAISFGFAEFDKDFKAMRHLKLVNKGRESVSFNVGTSVVSGDPHSVKLSRSHVTVPGSESVSISVSLTVPAATAGDTSTFNEAAGFVTLTPTHVDDNNGVALKLPYYLVERARSDVSAEFKDRLSLKQPTTLVKLRNDSDAGRSGSADFYALGLLGTRQGAAPYDIRAVGVQTFPIGPTTNLMVFAVNTFDRFNTAAPAEVDVYVDSTGDGKADYLVFSIDHGWLTTGSADGQAVVGVQNLSTNSVVMRYSTDAPTDGSTMLLPVRTSDLGLTVANPRLSYEVVSYNYLNGTSNVVPGVASFNAFTPAISNGDWVELAAQSKASVPVSMDVTEWLQSPALGVMVVERDNLSGSSQASLLKVSR
jgi:subtilisin family serine protease